jgi:hypothetical protein
MQQLAKQVIDIHLPEYTFISRLERHDRVFVVQKEDQKYILKLFGEDNTLLCSPDIILDITRRMSDAGIALPLLASGCQNNMYYLLMPFAKQIIKLDSEKVYKLIDNMQLLDVCHSDLYQRNIVEYNNRPYFIDFENSFIISTGESNQNIIKYIEENPDLSSYQEVLEEDYIFPFR